MEHKVFALYIAALSVNLGNKIYSLKKAEIAHLEADKALTEVFGKYTNFADNFLLKLDSELLKYTSFNNYAIEFVDN